MRLPSSMLAAALCAMSTGGDVGWDGVGWGGEGQKNCVPLTAPRGARPPPAPSTGEGRGGVATSAVGPVTCHKAGPISFAPPPPHTHTYSPGRTRDGLSGGLTPCCGCIDLVRVQTRPPGLRCHRRLDVTASPYIPSAVMGDVAAKRELGCRPFTITHRAPTLGQRAYRAAFCHSASEVTTSETTSVNYPARLTVTVSNPPPPGRPSPSE